MRKLFGCLVLAILFLGITGVTGCKFVRSVDIEEVSVYHTWVHILNIGIPSLNDDRKFKIDHKDLENICDVFKQYEVGIPVIIDHGTGAYGDTAVGWIKELKLKDDSLWGKVYWTDLGVKLVRTQQYRYTSIRFMKEEDKEGYLHVRSLLEVSLVNIPAVRGLRPVYLADVEIPELIKK